MDFSLTEQRNDFNSDALEATPLGELQQLLLWRNWRKTALVFCLLLTFLMDIAANSVISVVSVASIITLFVSFGYYCIVWGMRKLHKSTSVDHPHQHFLDIKWSISEQSAQRLASVLVRKLNPTLLRLRSLMLIEDPLDSLKLLFLLFGLNMLGDYINGISLLLAVFILLFTLPKVYEWKKSAINMELQHLQQFNSHFLSSKKLNFAEKMSAIDPHQSKPNDHMRNECEFEESTDEFPSFEEASDNVFMPEFCCPTQSKPLDACLANKQQKKDN